MKTKRLLAMVLTLIMIVSSAVSVPFTAEAKTKRPAATAFTSVTMGSNSIKFKWKRKAKVRGYQLQYGTKADLSNARRLTIKKAAVTAKTVKKIKRNRKYYARIRTYKTVKDKKIFSKWSKVKVISPAERNTEATVPKTVDQKTCKHTYKAISYRPAIIDEEGSFYGYCTKCGKIKDEKIPALKADLDKSHYAAPKPLYEEGAGIHKKSCQNSSYSKGELVLSYGTCGVAFEYQTVNNFDLFCHCRVCEKNDPANAPIVSFLKKHRYYNTDFWKGFCYSAYKKSYTPDDEAIQEQYNNNLTYFAVEFHSYYHICLDYNGGEPIFYNQSEGIAVCEKVKYTDGTVYKERRDPMMTWFYNKYGYEMLDALNTSYWRWYTVRQISGTYSVKTQGSDFVTGAGYYPARKDGAKVFKSSLGSSYVGYYWYCPTCYEHFPAYYKDGTMAGVPISYLQFTISDEYPFEYDHNFAFRTETTKKVSNARQKELDKKYGVVRSRLKIIDCNWGEQNPKYYEYK